MLIGISGKAQSGKDTAGQYLVDHYNFQRVASADALKRIARNIFGWNALKDEKGRRFLQELGCTIRNYDQNYWINLTVEEIKKRQNTFKQDNFVVTDVRFLNEAKLLKDNNALLIRIERPGLKQDTHVSETELDDFGGFDYVIDNDKTIDDLNNRLKNILSVEELHNENTNVPKTK